MGSDSEDETMFAKSFTDTSSLLTKKIKGNHDSESVSPFLI